MDLSVQNLGTATGRCGGKAAKLNTLAEFERLCTQTGLTNTVLSIGIEFLVVVLRQKPLAEIGISDLTHTIVQYR